MKKILLLLVLALTAMMANAEFNVGSYRYNVLQSGEVECTGFSSTALTQNPTSAYIPGRVTLSGTEYKVYSIAANAFKNNTTLRYVQVDWGVVAIDHEAFYGCTSLYSVRLPSTITRLDTYAFGNCTSMTVFGIAATTLPYVASSAFDGMKKCNVHVATEAARTAYNASSIWTRIDTDGSVARTPNLAFDFADANRYYVIHTARTVSSNSAKATLIGVTDNVTYIPITNVTDNFPKVYGGCSTGYTANLTRIAPYACQGNTKLTSIGRTDLGSTTYFEYVGASAFQNCTSLTFVGIPRGIIDAEAFKGCTSLSTVQLYSNYDMDNGVYELGANAFNGCTNLHELLLYNTNNGISFANGAIGNNASDFKCYVPIKGYYTTRATVYEWSSTQAAKVHPCIVPKTEWTPISCYKDMFLPSDAQFYYVPDFSTSGDNIIANKKQITGSVEASQGLLMKATPGNIYRFTTTTSGTGTKLTSNWLHGIFGDSDNANTYSYFNGSDGNTKCYTGYEFNPATRIFDRIMNLTAFYSGEAYLYYPEQITNVNIYLQGVTEPYGLSIAGQDVNSANCGDLTVLNNVNGDQVKFDPSTRTLTLKNATINGLIYTEKEITIYVIGTTTTQSIRLDGSYSHISTITGGGTLNMLAPLYSLQQLTIKGDTKVSITGATPNQGQYTSVDYAIDHPSMDNNHHAVLTLEGAGTELRLISSKHLLRSTLALNDGLYIAKPTATSLKTFGWSVYGGVLVDAYGAELYNTEVLITAASPRGFKYNGLWYETTATNTVQVIEPQRGDNYTGDVIIPEFFTRGSQVWVPAKIDTCAFKGTSVTSIEVPPAVTSIGAKAFYGAKNLKTLVLLPEKAPNKYTLLGDNFVGNNATGFVCYVKNSSLLTWMQNHSSINFLPWVKTNSENGFLTFSCARPITLPEGLTAYRVTGFNTSKRMATTTKLTNSRIPSKTGVILKGEPGTRYLLTTATTTSNIGDNMLHSFLAVEDIPYAPFATTPDDTKAYFLGNSCVEWYQFQNSIDLFMVLDAGIAYLVVDKSLLGNDYTSPVKLDLWTTVSDYPRGDVNGDYKVDVEDVNAVINIILEQKTCDDYPGNADIVGGDNKVDIEDVNAIINIILSN
ncbi:MAG: leucine-rich repeat protein [Muribaculaceae bacterium]|nr:leucine-rich repeat protein [Muribaculaceae bacterium]